MGLYYFQSPHQQIAESFWAKVVKVTDGDTIRVSAPFRDFDFRVRFANIMAKEMNEGGREGRDFLADLILGAEVEIVIDPQNRVEKWGRLLGKVQHLGFDVGEEMIQKNFAVGVWQEQMGIKDLVINLDIL